MENLANACLEYAATLPPVHLVAPKVYTMADYVGAGLFFLSALIGQFWLMGKACDIFVDRVAPFVARRYWRAKEAYVFWRYPEPTEEQERAMWDEMSDDEVVERIRHDVAIIRLNLDRW